MANPIPYPTNSYYFLIGTYLVIHLLFSLLASHLPASHLPASLGLRSRDAWPSASLEAPSRAAPWRITARWGLDVGYYYFWSERKKATAPCQPSETWRERVTYYIIYGEIDGSTW